ncbi:MAG TPA: ABC transporter permease [Vicinamibacterales bacterium]|nr:ABC transporter permease [Vicinamibacterales bacterium]
MELLQQTWANLTANKLRSFLTMVGIIWGVVSIVVLSGLGEGFQRGNQKVLEELGKNILIIRNGRTSLQAGGSRAGRPVRLTIQDVHELKTRSRLLEHVTPELMRGGLQIKSRFNASSLQMSGVWPVFLQIRTVEVDRGRLLNQADCDEARRVALIGFDASRQLFADRDPTGHGVNINGIPYTIVGRVRKKSQDSNYTGEDNQRLFLPYETMRRDFPLPEAFGTADGVSAIIAAPRPEVTAALAARIEREGVRFMGLDSRGPVEDEVRAILAPKHDFLPEDTEAINFWNTALQAVMFGKMIDGMHRFFVAVSIVTLLLGGIGVMNIMLIAVRERTREIGVRKALGATAGAVQRQFFSEGLALTLVSGAIGFIVGLGLCALVNLAPMPERFAGLILTWQTATLAIVALSVIGVAASVYPARRAAKLPPIEALRYEM